MEFFLSSDQKSALIAARKSKPKTRKPKQSSDSSTDKAKTERAPYAEDNAASNETVRKPIGGIGKVPSQLLPHRRASLNPSLLRRPGSQKFSVAPIDLSPIVLENGETIQISTLALAMGLDPRKNQAAAIKLKQVLTPRPMEETSPRNQNTAVGNSNETNTESEGQASNDSNNDNTESNSLRNSVRSSGNNNSVVLRSNPRRRQAQQPVALEINSMTIPGMMMPPAASTSPTFPSTGGSGVGMPLGGSFIGGIGKQQQVRLIGVPRRASINVRLPVKGSDADSSKDRGAAVVASLPSSPASPSTTSLLATSSAPNTPVSSPLGNAHHHNDSTDNNNSASPPHSSALVASLISPRIMNKVSSPEHSNNNSNSSDSGGGSGSTPNNNNNSTSGTEAERVRSRIGSTRHTVSTTQGVDSNIAVLRQALQKQVSAPTFNQQANTTSSTSTTTSVANNRNIGSFLSKSLSSFPVTSPEANKTASGVTSPSPRGPTPGSAHNSPRNSMVVPAATTSPRNSGALSPRNSAEIQANQINNSSPRNNLNPTIHNSTSATATTSTPSSSPSSSSSSWSSAGPAKALPAPTQRVLFPSSSSSQSQQQHQPQILYRSQSRPSEQPLKEQAQQQQQHQEQEKDLQQQQQQVVQQQQLQQQQQQQQQQSLQLQRALDVVTEEMQRTEKEIEMIENAVHLNSSTAATVNTTIGSLVSRLNNNNTSPSSSSSTTLTEEVTTASNHLGQLIAGASEASSSSVPLPSESLVNNRQ